MMNQSSDVTKKHRQYKQTGARTTERRLAGKHYFGRGGIKFALLKLLSGQPMHGYQIMKTLEEQSGGLYQPSAGSIYPTLQLLEASSFIAICTEDNGKKVYRITEQGRSALLLLTDKSRGKETQAAHLTPDEQSFRHAKICRKLALSTESYDLFCLVTRAEQEAFASKERTELLQRLLSEQHHQLSAFLANGETLTRH
ncbi:PadR family transcriptional regulator [Paenibacillus sinopodophylli]|uniref:PadR family transcriptional regulator n=1 Tax=Paenibacillus sinopodophylli TaxID=1837342 RepID=UPI00110D03B3|nr:PadR family transcriptional regulator [Paenibacillus sinopodophylli]